MTDTPVILAAFARTASSETRLIRKEYRGQPVVDLRLYWRDTAGQWQPSRKGATLKPDELPEVIRALSALVQEGSDHA